MQLAAFNATCPFEIGDAVYFCGQSIGKTQDFLNCKTITDIACVHYLKNGVVEFRYEFDNSGVYVPIQTKTAYAHRNGGADHEN